MASITLKSIPDDLYGRLKQRAAEHRRSINSEILVCLERYLRSAPLDPEDFLRRVKALQGELGLPPITEDQIQEAKTAGRP